MDREPDIFEKIGVFFKAYPAAFGIFIILIGLGLLICALKDVSWIFGNTLSYNIQKVQGWANLFGRNTTRFIVGVISVVLMVIGIFWIYIA